MTQEINLLAWPLTCVEKKNQTSSFFFHLQKYIPTTFETYTHTLERGSFTMQVGVWDTSGRVQIISVTVLIFVSFKSPLFPHLNFLCYILI